MKRNGFTMIELIFVIVILGILASVAIPKLAATRDDAKVSKALNEISALKNDMSAYYTSRGTYNAANIVDETNVPLYTAKSCASYSKATMIASGSTYYYCVPKTSSGLEPVLTINPNDTNGTLTFGVGSGNGNIATAIKANSNFIALTANAIQNGGSRVSY